MRTTTMPDRNADNMLSEEEFSFCGKIISPRIPIYDPFTLVNMDEAECKAEFRVEKK